MEAHYAVGGPSSADPASSAVLQGAAVPLANVAAAKHSQPVKAPEQHPWAVRWLCNDHQPSGEYDAQAMAVACRDVCQVEAGAAGGLHGGAHERGSWALDVFPPELDLVAAPCRLAEDRGARERPTSSRHAVPHGCAQLHGQQQCACGEYPTVPNVLS